MIPDDKRAAEEKKTSETGGEEVRQKVLRHLKMATTAGIGVALACSGACGASSSSQQHPTTTIPEAPPIVCDPLPPPIRCDMEMIPQNLATILTATAIRVETDKGPAVKVSLELPGYPGAEVLSIAGRPELKGGKTLTERRERNIYELVALPDPGRKNMELKVLLQCKDRRLPIRMNVEWTANAIKGTSLKVTLL